MCVCVCVYVCVCVCVCVCVGGGGGAGPFLGGAEPSWEQFRSAQVPNQLAPSDVKFYLTHERNTVSLMV